MTYISKADTSNGVMVALYPTPATAAMLAQPGGEMAQDLHVTLAYLGDASEFADPVGLATCVQMFAGSMGPVAGEISGTGRFTAGPEPVSYASVDVPGLEDFRARLLDALEGAGFEPDTSHGFVPHCTLAYGSFDDPYIPNLPLVFDTVTAAVGGERQTFTLTGNALLSKGEDVSGAAWSGSPAHFTDDQWQNSCLLDRGATFHTPKTRYALPVREPDGTLNKRALSAAQSALNGGRGGVKAPPAAITAAKRKLATLRDQADLSKAEAEWQVPIWKAQDTDEQIVYGVVLQPGVTDSQGDVVSAEEIEKAAHRWLTESRLHDVQHDMQPNAQVVPVESFIAPAQLEVAGRPVLKGSWVMAAKINDPELWGKVRKGEITGYSIGGSAIRSEH